MSDLKMALHKAKAEAAAIPEVRRCRLNDRFDQATAAASFHATYVRRV